MGLKFTDLRIVADDMVALLKLHDAKCGPLHPPRNAIRLVLERELLVLRSIKAYFTLCFFKSIQKASLDQK